MGSEGRGLRGRKPAIASFFVLAAALAPGEPLEEEGPHASELRRTYLGLKEEIAKASAKEAPALEGRLAELTGKLSGAEARWAGELERAWGDRLLEGLHDFSKAEQAYARARQAFEKGKDEKGLAVSAKSRGVALYSLSRFPEALLEYDRAAEAYSRLEDRRGLAQIAQNRGNVHNRCGRFKEALAEYEKASTLFQEIGDDLSLAVLAQNRGVLLYQQGRFEAALAEYAKSEVVFEKRGDRGKLAMVYLNRGSVLQSSGKFQDALKEYDRCRAILEKLKDRPRLAQLALNRANVLNSLDRFSEALEEYDHAYQVFEEVGNRASLALVCQNRGAALASLGAFGKALEELGRAEEIFRDLRNPAGAAGVASNRGAVFQSLGRHEEAFTEYEKAARFYRASNDEPHLAQIAQNRGNVFNSLGRYEEALKEYREAEAVYQKVGKKKSLALIQQNRGGALAGLERNEEALESCRAAQALFRESGNAAQAAALGQNAGVIFFNLRRYEEALTEYDRAKAAYQDLGDEHHLARLAMNRGNALQKLDRFQESLGEYAAAEAVFRKTGDRVRMGLVSQNRAAAFLHLGRPRDALEEYGTAARILEETLRREVEPLGEESSLSFRASARGVLSGVLKSLGSIPDAGRREVALAYHAVQVFHGLGMAQLLAERGHLAAPTFPPELKREFEDLEAKLATACARRLKLTREKRAPSLPEQERQEEAVRAAGRQVEELEADRERIIERLRIQDRAYAAVVYPRAAEPGEVEEALPAGTALLEYLVDDEGAYAFVVTGREVKAVSLGEPAGLREEARKALEALMEAKDGVSTLRARAPLRELGKRVLSPLLVALPEADAIHALLLSLDGELCRIPMEALLVEDGPEGAPPASWPFLVRRFEVGYVHSGTSLRDLAAVRDRENWKVEPFFVGFGYPFYGFPDEKDQAAGLLLALQRGEGLKPLPGTLREVSAIARMLSSGPEEEARIREGEKLGERPSDGKPPRGEIHGRNFALFLGLSANEKALKTREEVRRASVLHLACHAEADLTSPTFSHLALSRSPALSAETGEDGFLTLPELRDLGLAADLLVLSACETNAGILRPFEGIAGLSRSGLAAGAHAVISTLWQVEDRTAGDLLVGFYRRWLRERASRLKALSEAKRESIGKGMALKDWSGFVLWDCGR
jgi:tetratricopeptide (TPR) repeat protein/CHAT domain-containing protein